MVRATAPIGAQVTHLAVQPVLDRVAEIKTAGRELHNHAVVCVNLHTIDVQYGGGVVECHDRGSNNNK